LLLQTHCQWFMQDGASCCGLSAWHFRLACHLKPFSWSFHMWTELPLNSPDLRINPCDCFLQRKIFFWKSCKH
jgi:hypothetical protein